MIFGEDNPAGGYEVLTKPPLGKCSINIIFPRLLQIEAVISHQKDPKKGGHHS
jgi:hypothetical protein